MSKTEEKLSVRQEEFVNNYLLCGSAYKAAMLAGYAPSTAKVKSAKWLEKGRIANRIAELREKLQHKVVFTIAEWFENVRATELRAKQAGNIKGEQRAQEMEAKYLGAYEKNNEQLTSKQVVIVNFADIDINE